MTEVTDDLGATRSYEQEQPLPSEDGGAFPWGDAFPGAKVADQVSVIRKGKQFPGEQVYALGKLELEDFHML